VSLFFGIGSYARLEWPEWKRRLNGSNRHDFFCRVLWPAEALRVRFEGRVEVSVRVDMMGDSEGVRERKVDGRKVELDISLKRCEVDRRATREGKMGGYQTAIAGGDGEAKARWTLRGACCEFRGLVVELVKLRGREGVKRTEVSNIESPSTSTFDFHKRV
jgi:hypothetical protein